MSLVATSGLLFLLSIRLDDWSVHHQAAERLVDSRREWHCVIPAFCHAYKSKDAADARPCFPPTAKNTKIFGSRFNNCNRTECDQKYKTKPKPRQISCNLLIDCNTFYNHTLQNAQQIFYQAQFATFLIREKKKPIKIMTKKKKNKKRFIINATLDNRNQKPIFFYIKKTWHK